ncbi:NifU family protein [Roseospira visakhapatnamensis]|uniref:Fe-S cluster biogenesis protein NfuA n=1 Tax=Roseospira visakhapatnamensis TaxID=390880 RepID=A0A7W6RCY0_9PROT|nr:NifU family protein [Roseospira visakhapatnamensis]MBB4266259.1 Fe-S cluster biogenesis protein NfuA [Roseospira visakhapatnamensis]
MFIQTEPTPNPASLKFLPGEPVLGQGTAQFDAPDQAGPSPMASRLFRIPGVSAVFLGGDFITVSKADDTEWSVLKPRVLGAIMDHYTAGEPILVGGADDAGATDGEDAVVRQIRELLDTRVRPAVAQDGGDIIFHDFQDGVVYLHMRGACSGCPSSTATLKHGIENMLRYYVPEVQGVEAVM